MRLFIEQIVGNSALKERLLSDITGDTFLHAYIIEGAKGSGKRTLSRYVAASLCCEQKSVPDAPLPCGLCPSCRKIIAGISPDVISVRREEGRATMGVDTVRYIRTDVYSVPNDLERKIYVIEEADKMTQEAQNAFLLTLEEPPKYAGFLLLCEDAGAFLETIRSRAPILRTESLPTDMIDSYICENDARARSLKSASPEQYAELLVSANGGIGTALELLEEKNLTPLLQRRALAKDFVRMALTGTSAEGAMSLIPRFSQKRDALSPELELIYLALRDIALTKKSEHVTLCFYEDMDIAAELSEECSLASILDLMGAVDAARDSISRNANAYLTLINLLTQAKMLL